MKQQCVLRRFIVINDNLNIPIMESLCEIDTGKSRWGMRQEGGRERRTEKDFGRRESNTAVSENGMG